MLARASIFIVEISLMKSKQQDNLTHENFGAEFTNRTVLVVYCTCAFIFDAFTFKLVTNPCAVFR